LTPLLRPSCRRSGAGPPSRFLALAAPAGLATIESTAPAVDSSLVVAIATIQATVAASQERQRATSLALEHERAMCAALTAHMATAQRLFLGHPPVDHETPPPTPEAAHGLDVDHVTTLHAQVVGLHNIRSLVSIVLDPTSSHYPRWRGQVLTLWRYALADHVLVDLVNPPSPSWCMMDSVVLSWLHDTITIELQDIIHDQADTNQQVWLALEEQFLGNRDARVLHLDTQFYQFSQGGPSMGEYCRQMKVLADSLRDLGEPVADRTLVLNLMRGLSPHYGHLKALIKRTVPFPTFHVVRNELLLEELTMATEAPSPASALYNAPPDGQVSSGRQAPRPSSTGAPARLLPRPLRSLVQLPPPTERRPRKGGRGGGGSTREGSTG
jgi:hypothetical protein